MKAKFDNFPKMMFTKSLQDKDMISLGKEREICVAFPLKVFLSFLGRGLVVLGIQLKTFLLSYTLSPLFIFIFLNFEA